jgi:exonuclease VII small subunit
MNKNLTINSKISQFKKVWLAAKADAKSANLKAMEAGRILSELKAENNRGWAKYVELELKGIIGLDQADNLIRCYEGRYLVSLLSDGEFLPISSIKKLIAEATPEQIAQAEQLKREEEDRLFRKQSADAYDKAMSAKAIPAPQPAPKPAPDIIDGEFTEIKPAPKPAPVVEPEPDEDDQTEALLEEYESRVQHLIKDNARLETILNDDDQLAAALLELKKVNAAYKNLQEHLAGVQNQLNANIKLANYWKKEHDKLKKAMEAA